MPNLFTTAGLLAGFYAIVAAIDGRFEAAAMAIFGAMILDSMDGRIARLTGTESDFGVQYDSLADMVSFGLAPALIMRQWALAGFGKLGWLAACLYVAAAALRLARFNTQAGSADKRYFQGLPSPAAAALLAGLVWFGEANGLRDDAAKLLLAFPATVLAGALMVSNIRYHSFKQIKLHGKVSFVTISVIALVFALVASKPSLVLFPLAAAYAVSGPAVTLALLRRHRAQRGANAEEERG